MEKKIMICGASGVGKTTLASHMSELYTLPYITTSASKLWPKYGFQSHKEALEISLANKEIGYNYQMDVLGRRHEILGGLPRYITDRSYIDNITYFLMQLGQTFDEEDIQGMIDEINEVMVGVDGLIFIRFNEQTQFKIEGKRVENKYYQSMVDAVMAWVIKTELVRLPVRQLELAAWDFETRIKIVDTWVKSL